MGRLSGADMRCDQGETRQTREGKEWPTDKHGPVEVIQDGRRGWLAGGRRSVKFWRSCPLVPRSGGI